MSRLDEIKKQLPKDMEGVFEYKKLRKQCIAYYSLHEERLNKASSEQFDNYPFLTELLGKCKRKENGEARGKEYIRI